MPDPSASPDPRRGFLAQLVQTLEPMLARVAELRPESRSSAAEVQALEDAMNQQFPADSEQVRAVGKAFEEGVAAGWLCDRGAPNARFSRVARASSETHDLSIAAVRLRGPALRHTHTRGEVTLAFAVDGAAPTFEGRERGWIVMGAGSTHVPEVVGGCMNLIYFLPGGAVEWHT